jgi:CheY-like chemotaxis protein
MDGELAVLCVDDELSVLAGLTRQLRRMFKMSIAGSGAEALEVIRNAPQPFAVIVSDMMMPGMNGAEFLRQSRVLSPQSVRVLLTGHADAQAAASAVNDGGISHFLTKPCPTERLVETLQLSADAFRRAAVERDVLERTVRGSVSALAQTLALAAPTVFARAGRVARTVTHLIDVLDPPDTWAIEVAVPLSQVGAVALPAEVLDSWHEGRSLTSEETALVGQVTDLSLSIIQQIPRLEVVCDIIAGAFSPEHPDRMAHPGSRILRVAYDLDVIQSSGIGRPAAIERLRGHLGPRVRDVLDALAVQRAAALSEVRLTDLKTTMTVARDVLSDAGLLLVGRGTPVSPALIARLRNFCNVGAVPATIWVEEET